MGSAGRAGSAQGARSQDAHATEDGGGQNANSKSRIGSAQEPAGEQFDSLAAKSEKLMRQLQDGGDGRQRAIEEFSGQVWALSQHAKGTYAVQAAFQNHPQTRAAELELLKELRGHVMQAIFNPHANWVISKVVSVFPQEDAEFVFPELRGRAEDMACQQYGCRILLQLMSRYGAHPCVKELLDDAASLEELGPGRKVYLHGLGDPALDGQQGLIDALTVETGCWRVKLSKGQVADVKPENLRAYHICHSQFGRPVAQAILRTGASSQIKRMVKALQADLIANATHKRASRVVEAVLKDPECRCSRQVCQEFVDTLLENVQPLAKSKWGFYVLKSLWETRPEFREQVRHQLEGLKSAEEVEDFLKRLDDRSFTPRLSERRRHAEKGLSDV